MTGLRKVIEQKIDVLPQEMQEEMQREQQEEQGHDHDLERWENEGGGGSPTSEEREQEKQRPSSEGRLFLERRFLKALGAQTMFDKVIWRQTGSEFKEYTRIYEEYWETVTQCVRIELKFERGFGIINIGGIFFFREKTIVPKTSGIQVVVYYDGKMASLGVGTSSTDAMLLYQEIKEQQGRDTQRWRRTQLQLQEEQSVYVSEKVSGFADLLDKLAVILGMPEIVS